MNRMARLVEAMTEAGCGQEAILEAVRSGDEELEELCRQYGVS